MTPENKTTFIVYKSFLIHVLQTIESCCYTQLHGYDIVEWSFNHYFGSSTAGNNVAEKIIRLLVDQKILEPLECRPNISQQAFTGLSVNNKYYKQQTKNFETARTFETHFYFHCDYYKAKYYLENILED